MTNRNSFPALGDISLIGMYKHLDPASRQWIRSRTTRASRMMWIEHEYLETRAAHCEQLSMDFNDLAGREY